MASKKNHALVPPTRSCKCGDKCSYRGGSRPFSGPANKVLKDGPAFFVKRSDLENPTPPTYCLYCRQHQPKTDFVPWSEWARHQLALQLVAGETEVATTATVIPVPEQSESEQKQVAVG